MFIEFCKKLEQSKLLPWVGVVFFIIGPLVIMYNGATFQVVGILLFFGSAFAGVAMGRTIGNFLGKKIFIRSSQLAERLGRGCACFLFLFLPPLVATWTNSFLHTDTEMYSLGVYFLWACFGGVMFFCLKSSESEE